jgi:hypothetical protein
MIHPLQPFNQVSGIDLTIPMLLKHFQVQCQPGPQQIQSVVADAPSDQPNFRAECQMGHLGRHWRVLSYPDGKLISSRPEVAAWNTD